MEEYTALLAHPSNPEDIFRAIAQLARRLGFEHCSYGMRLPLPAGTPTFSLHSDYPDSWSRRYVDNNYFGIDPTVAYALRESAPMCWAAESPMGSAEFWEEARQHQISHGWCMPSRGQFGTVGLLTLSRSAEQVSPRELVEKEQQMITLTLLAHSAMSQLIAPGRMPECRQRLTPREREVLQWFAAGKTYCETGVILSIDDRTVKFHLRNAMTKLQASNKAHAVFKATVLGMI